MINTQSAFTKEITLKEAVEAYKSGKNVVIRFHDEDWYAAYLQNIEMSYSDMTGITLDMLPHARYFVEE